MRGRRQEEITKKALMIERKERRKCIDGMPMSETKR